MIFLAILASAVMFACGSNDQATAPNARSAERTTNSNPAVAENRTVAAPQPGAPGQPTTAVNGQAGIPPAPVDPATAVSTDANSAAADAIDPRKRKMDLVKQGQLNSQAGAPPKPVPQPAPDNSTYTVVLADAVRESRIFRAHPQLAKVEKVTDTSGATIKVYLKSGQVVSLPGDRIPMLSTAPASAIMNAVGAPAAAARRDAVKKDSQE
jgi:hypothetical protein